MNLMTTTSGALYEYMEGFQLNQIIMTTHRTHGPSADKVGISVDCEAEHRITKTISQILESLSRCCRQGRIETRT
jgi:prephenate dehydratase